MSPPDNAETQQPDLDAFLGAKQQPAWRRWLKWAVIGIVLLGLVLLLSHCFASKKEAGYVTQPVTRGALSVTVSATGNLKPTNQVEVGSEISGRIDEVLVDVNDRVRKGQTLAVINTDVLDDQITQSRAALNARRAAVAQAEATVAESQASLARLQEVSRLSGGKVPSKTEMETAIANVARAKAALQSARADVVSAEAQLSSNETNRSRAIVRSPVSGVVLSRQVEPGQTVAASFNTPTLFILAEDLGSMELEVSIDEADVGQVKEGQPATFAVDAYPGRRFPARIERVDLASNSLASTTSSSSTTTSTSSNSVVAYNAVLGVTNPEGLLRPGMTATAEIETQQANNALLIPNSALRFTPTGGAAAAPSGNRGVMGGLTGPRFRMPGNNAQAGIGAGSEQTIYIVGANGQPQPISVVTGQTDGRVTAVTSDKLKPGMQVITGRKAAPDE